MNYRKYEQNADYNRVINFLTDCYKENGNLQSWLPQRFDDLFYRLDTLYYDERGQEKSSDYIYIFEENNEIIGLILPDGDSVNTCIKSGFDHIFVSMLDVSEKELLPLFSKDNDGKIDFLVISHDSLAYQSEILQEKGYTKDEAQDYDNVLDIKNNEFQINLPEGYKQVYGENLDDNIKAKACYYGFEPKEDDGILTGTFKEGLLAYNSRKKSRYFNDSFESLVVTDDGDICTYTFCYVDFETNTAYIEPVCTREKYRKKGFCKQTLYGIFIRLKQMGIAKVYINSYDWRKKVYNSAGFETIDAIGFWRKKL